MLATTACAPAHDTEADALYPADEQAQWQDFLQQQEKDKGVMKSYTIDDVAGDTVYRGKFYVFTVHTQNEKHDAKELITLFKKLDEKQMHVVAHKIVSVK